VIKICGLTRLEDVLLARDLGAWAVGFVFAPSPRRVTPGAARRLLNEAVLERGLPLTIGVFTDATADEIAWVVEEVGLDGVQLHGLLGPGGNAVRRALGDWERPLLVIQAVPVDPERAAGGEIKEAVAEACEEADAVLLDTSSRGRFGGTGMAFPWRLACEAGEGTAVLVAGGINPDTVATALKQSGAWGVDVSSGIEQAPGIKDPGLMRRLFAEAGVKPRTVPDGRGSVFRQPPSDRGAADDRDERQEGPDK
jgi:phosphoribosylanthranilate isomerase